MTSSDLDMGIVNRVLETWNKHLIMFSLQTFPTLPLLHGNPAAGARQLSRAFIFLESHNFQQPLCMMLHSPRAPLPHPQPMEVSGAGATVLKDCWNSLLAPQRSTTTAMALGGPEPWRISTLFTKIQQENNSMQKGNKYNNDSCSLRNILDVLPAFTEYSISSTAKLSCSESQLLWGPGHTAFSRFFR